MSKWAEEHLAMLKGVKTRNEQQELLVLLAAKGDRTKDEQRQFDVLLRAEKAKEQAKKAVNAAAEMLGESKKRERAARTHELCEVAGLLIQAGLVDTKTGKPVWSRGELLGGLLAMAQAQDKPDHLAQWKRQGDAFLASKKAG